MNTVWSRPAPWAAPGFGRPSPRALGGAAGLRIGHPETRQPQRGHRLDRQPAGSKASASSCKIGASSRRCSGRHAASPKPPPVNTRAARPPPSPPPPRRASAMLVVKSGSWWSGKGRSNTPRGNSSKPPRRRRKRRPCDPMNQARIRSPAFQAVACPARPEFIAQYTRDLWGAARSASTRCATNSGRRMRTARAAGQPTPACQSCRWPAHLSSTRSRGGFSSAPTSAVRDGESRRPRRAPPARWSGVSACPGRWLCRTRVHSETQAEDSQPTAVARTAGVGCGRTQPKRGRYRHSRSRPASASA